MSGSPSVAGFVDLPFTLDNDPADRRWDRLLAYLGLIDDAAPMFRDAQAVPHAGVLLALPALLATGVLTLGILVISISRDSPAGFPWPR